ncbi:single-stranded-DNA-specific exonuclease RecJ [Salinibius halmophilus]|uniref:single-stranded-DNA-specific exonuclease RecJ n=1 Tax=Salinibius halmophilus TaxID=1853216 RepID=UPI001F2A3704|nr:single-stranded-DNA-specific exonuclease RecJ [Salinibius halmophilus]
MRHPAIVRRQVDQLNPHMVAQHGEVIARLLAARGVNTPQDGDLSLQSLAHFQSLKGIDAGAELLQQALLEQWSVLIVGDFDVDGATSTALAVQGLKAFGFQQVDYLVPNRFSYGYGLTPGLVGEAAKLNPNLIITVDNGIAAVDGVQAAQALGIKVLVTDHHLPGDQLPEAQAIVNPNQPGCQFPSKAACGCAVMFYLLSAFRARLKAANDPRWQVNMGQFLDLLALATVADVVPLDHNNRIMVAAGIQRIRKGQARPGIMALIEVAGRQYQRIEAADFGFALGPRINAAGRLDDMSIGIECLLTENAATARELATLLDSFNRDRRSIEQSMHDDALQALQAIKLDEQPTGVVLFEPSWHQGVVGILASRIKERLHRPVIAFAMNDEQTELKGSGRSIPGLHLRDMLDLLDKRYPNLISKFGGHAMAAGLTIAADNIQAFRQAFNHVIETQIDANLLNPELLTDGSLPASLRTIEFCYQLKTFGPYGQKFPEPCFDDYFTIIQQRIVGEKHLKLLLQDEAGQTIDAIAFNVDLDIWPNQARQAHVVYQLDANHFRGNTSLQLMVQYIEPK